ncbi:MAG TPA: hypothetical protein PK191_08465 [Niabella sp.]|nr:hypothetical protein [Niabella sp.]HOZ95635.1 hypothetical protein [Niabella sp.]HQW13875.1 hypothetical protein [Niabella sp.]HQX19232.1 hypothetical protein [Niabella sp.]HQX41049.1 hypothetical protein [Niabella sp.]
MPKTENDRKKFSDSENLFEALNPDRIMANANKVLSAAVNVLEEEIAAGILAAKKFEKKIIDVEDVREDSQDLMNRIRRDVHEAVDLLMDSVSALTKQFSVLAKNESNQTQSKSKPEAKKEAEIPVVKNSKRVIAGETILLKLALLNSEQEKSINIQFQKVDLVGPKNERILQKHIVIDPESLNLNGSEGEVSIKVAIPKKTPSGQYCGLFVDANDCFNKAIIQVDVS